MAGNTNTLSKKTIVAIVIAIVLLFVASLSVGIFLANRGDAEAAGGNQISDVNQTENNNQNTSSDNNQAPDQNTNIENNNTDSNNTENNNTENNNPETPNTDGNAGTVVDNNKTTNNNTNNNGTVDNAENNTENRTNNNTAGVTTDANVNQVGETTVTRVEERERLVSRDYWDWWTPTSVAVASTATRLSPTTPDITVEKTAMTEAGKNVVYAGQKITYTITVKNSGKKDVEKIEVTDKIPSNTTFESVENDGTVIKSENEEILGVKWLVDVKTGETTSVKFTVIVNENIEGTISNIAVANGEESNEENTAIITSEKTSEINRDGQKVEIAKVGDEIKYTITLNNTGKVDGITTISDKVPEGTELKANSAEGAKISDNNDMLLWENISVPAEGTISKSFVVIVKNIDSLKANKISNVATVGGKDTNPTEDTAATDITVTKVWKNMDSDAAKANIIDSIKLQLKVNGEVADEAVVTADEDWTHTFTDLPMYDENENKITYTIDEVVANIEDQAKLDLYNKSIENGVITNTFDPSKLTDTTEVSATKVWANMNSDAARENTITSIKLQVKANGEVAADQVVTADEDWTHTFTDLPVYDKAGNRITYTIDEVAVNAEDQTKLGLYVKTIDQAKGIITNTFDPSKLTDKTEVTATKVWANMDSDAARANTITSIKLQVKANGEVAAEQVVTAENNWTYTFKDLPVYDKAGNRITYTIDEVVANVEDKAKLDLYNKSIENGVITNTFDPSKLTDTTEVSATKVWANMNSDAARENTITSIKLQVKANGEVAADQVVTSKNNWTYTFKDLPVYDKAGNRITYTIDEVVANVEDKAKLDLYNKSIENGVITNTFDPSKLTDTTEVSATKVWANMNSDAARENTITSIKLQVKANGEVAADQVVTSKNNWTYTFKDLPVYDEAGNRITYTIDEAVANAEDQAKLGLYVKTIDQEKGIITNTFDPSKLTDKTEVSATKVWANMNSDAARTNTITSIKLQVKNGGTVVKEKEVTEKDNWTYTFTDLPVYDKTGNKITYTIDETVANNDDQSKLGLYDKSIENGVITNTFNPEKVTEKTKVTATKAWANMNSDAARANTITSIKLQVKNGGTVVKEKEVTEKDNWTYTFTDLPVYDKTGNKITYTIDETVANNDDQSKLGLYDKSIENGVITNTFNPEKVTEKTKVTATKAWANMNSDAARANTITSIKLQVKNGGTVVKEKEVTEKDNWTYTFTDLPVYDKTGNKITYTIDETVANNDDQAKLDLYDKSIENGVITNTFKPERVTEKTDITMTKIWEDNNNKFNTRPDSIILTVNGTDYKVEGTKTADLKTADSWSRTEKLPKYDAEGKEISYTATENTVPTGYEKVSEEGLTVTNRANELISKTAYKVDANGNIGSPATNKDTFAANETVYYKITLTNAGSEPISKTVTDEIPLRLTLNTVDGKTGESGTTDKGDNWTVTKNDKKQSVVTWEVKDLAAGDTRELIIKATVVAEAEYKDICNKTIDGTTAYTAKLFVRKDGKVPYEGSGTGYDASLYTGELGTVYLNSSDLHYDTNANLKNDDLYYLIKNNNIITDMVAKGITRTQLVDALKTNGTILADDEVVVWYVIKNESDGYHIDGVIRKISSLTEITNTAFTDKVSSDSTIKLEDIEIGQRGSITVKSITSSTDTVSTPMDVVFVLDTSGSMTYPLKGKNETAVENSRAKAMVNAVNSSIKTIMSKNKESRVGVVGFSGDASTIIPLGNYAQNIDYLTREYSAGGLMYSSSQTIKSNVGNKLSRQVTGGTNTQSGIKLGAEMLTSNQNTTTATVTLKDGTTKTITRTPLLILVTDGKPTYYYDNATATGKVNGYGYTNETNENYYYWTLRTAKYYKDQITNKYYPKNTDKTAKVFTIGIGLKGNEAVAMLDPTEKNVNACNNNNSQQKALYKLITDNGKIAPGAYSYATGSKTGEITESDLTGFLNTSIDSSSDNEKNRAITTEESKARRVELGTINEEKEFSLTVGTDSYTSLKAAMKAGYVKKATSTTYYLDLSEISRSTNVEIVYWN